MVNAIDIAYLAPSKANDCNSSIVELSHYINSDGGLVGQIKTEEDSSSPYKNAAMIVYFGLESKPWDGMGGSATTDQDKKNKAFLNSPKSLRPYAAKIIMACTNVFRVSIHGHEVGLSYTLHPDGSTRLDECAPREMKIPYPLGYTNCGY